MNQIQFETNGLTVLALSLEQGMTPLWIERDLLIIQQEHRPEYHDHFKLPSFGYNIHAVTDSMTEEQEKVLVQEDCYTSIDGEKGCWTIGDITFFCAESAFKQLLIDKGIDPNEKYVLLIKEK